MDDNMRTAFAIQFGILKGGKFDWLRGRWEERDDA